MAPGTSWYTLNEFSGEIEDLDRVASMFDDFYTEHLSKEPIVVAILGLPIRGRKPRKPDRRGQKPDKRQAKRRIADKSKARLSR